MRPAPLLCLLAALLLMLAPAAARADTYHLLLGDGLQSFDHPPVVRQGGREYVSGEVIARLGIAPLRGAYDLAGRTLVIGGEGLPPSLDGELLGSADVLDAGRARYLSLSLFERLGFRLSFEPLSCLYRLSAKIHRFDYVGSRGELALDCLTPLNIRANLDPEDSALILFTITGGWLAEQPALDFPTDPLVSRISVKPQPELGQSIVYVRQPSRIGQLIGRAPDGNARIRFGNFIEVSAISQSSSGELALTIELGGPTDARAQFIERPAQLVVDFPGVIAASELSRKISIGRATGVTLAPSNDGARLTVDLSARVDYRLLSAEGGARRYLQLLPYAPPGDLRALRASRAILLDSGHGGSDPGAIGVVGGVTEQSLNIKISAALASELTAMGYPVLYTRLDNRFVSLGARTDYAHLKLPWLFVSIHCNSFNPEMQGAITFIHPDAGAESRRAAQYIHGNLIASTEAVDKGVREEDFFVLRETAMPSVLIECGFMTHTIECGKLCDPNYQRRIAQGIAKGIDKFVTGG